MNGKWVRLYLCVYKVEKTIKWANATADGDKINFRKRFTVATGLSQHRYTML